MPTDALCRQKFLSTDNTGDNSIYNCSIFRLWLPSNVLISVLVLILIPQETGWERTACVYCSTHQREPYYVKGKSWESMLIAYPSCTAAFWTGPDREIYSAVATDNTLALTTLWPVLTMIWKWLPPSGKQHWAAGAWLKDFFMTGILLKWGEKRGFYIFTHLYQLLDL